jgi:hypothetical protein
MAVAMIRAIQPPPIPEPGRLFYSINEFAAGLGHCLGVF